MDGGRRGVGPFFRPYYAGRLRRKIFGWFGVSIAVTTAVVMSVANRSGPSGWNASLEHARAFVSGQFAEVWNDPPKRTALATAFAHDFEVGVRLENATGEALGTFGGKCDKGAIGTSVERAGHVLGRVEICNPGRQRSRFLTPVLVAMAMLWAASGAIAHRLVRPLSELARVASDIGRGQLKSRVHLSRRQGAEFQMVGDVMNDMASRIEKQLADQRALLATVSHEIRTPLSRMRLLIEFAREKTAALAANLAELRTASSGSFDGPAEPSPLRGPLHDLAELEREITEIDALVSDLLASSRVDFTALTHTTLRPADVAKTALEKAGLDGARLEMTGSDGTFTGDATLVARAVSNLLENARRHAGGAETLRVDVTSRVVAFVVEDRGPGFAPGEEKRVFEPFYKRAHTTPNGDASVGLGLALVKKIAEAHRGRVFAENRSGGGARVGVEFARSTEDAV